LIALSPLAANGRRLGVRAVERKSANRRERLKVRQNFLRAYTPHDAKPLVTVAQLSILYIKA